MDEFKDLNFSMIMICLSFKNVSELYYNFYFIHRKTTLIYEYDGNRIKDRCLRELYLCALVSIYSTKSYFYGLLGNHGNAMNKKFLMLSDTRR